MTGGVGPLSARYRVWLCDVWGVLHDGVTVFEDAVEALIRHREGGGRVILITNAPRLSSSVRVGLDRLGVDYRAYDGVVSSGDVTLSLLEKRDRSPFFHIGAPGLWDVFGLDPARVTPHLEEARVVLCTGLFPKEGVLPDEAWRVHDFSDLEVHVPFLHRMRSLGLTMVCANPDQVAEVGGRLVPCAGALAGAYRTLGGEVEMAGKPYAPIYERAFGLGGSLMGRDLERGEVLAIGDGLKTDVEGGLNFGVEVVYISKGIHRHDILGSLSGAGDVFSRGFASQVGEDVVFDAARGVTVLDRLFW